MFTPMNVNPTQMIKFIVGTGGIAKGQLAMVDSATAIDAVEGQSSAILIGIAAEAYDAGVVGDFYPIRGQILRAPVYQGSTVDAVTPAMVGVKYDLYVNSGDHMIDLNDTTGPMFIMQGYDNDRAECYVIVDPSLCYF